jgi:hypothetical protein
VKFWRALRTSFALNRPRNADPVELVSAGGLAAGRAAYRPSALLLPARPAFIWGTLLAALLLNLLPAGHYSGRVSSRSSGRRCGASRIQLTSGQIAAPITELAK